ncbi:MAG TPA: ABC transporter permease [Bryobacterales bacterium]|nr:ABC transporter permease [Bryobacterales bacterium]
MQAPPHVPGALFLRNLVRQRSLVFQLVRRDFEQRFVGSAVGWIWGIIHPLVLLAAYTFIFTYCLRQRLGPGQLTDNYPIFLFAGMLPWLLFQETVQRSASALVDYASLIKKSVFPAEIVPVAIFLSNLLSHFLALALLVAAVAVWLNRVSVLLVILPLYLVLIGLFSLGLAWIFSSLHVFLRDTAQVLSVVLTFWFWLTPIFITENQFPARLHWLVILNPLVYVVRGYRTAILSTRLPAASDLALLALFAAASFILGGLFFRHTKKGFADVL